MQRCTTLLWALLILISMSVPIHAQTGWGVDRYEGLRADTTGNGTLNCSWSTGNLGNTWNEGEWVPYMLTLKNVNINNPAFSDITVCYDFTKGNLDARFIDLVRSVQIGTVVRTNSQGWPMDSAGAAYPMTTRAQLETAQNSQGLTPWGTEYFWAGFKLLHPDTSRMNRSTTGGIGAPDDATRCFTITRQDIINAYGGINNVPNTSTFYIYFQMHEAQTFIWNNTLQSQLNQSPTDVWGGYLYDIAPFSTDQRNGSGFVSGASGHTYLTLGNKTVPIPIPPQPAGQLSGLKWHDINGNQVKDGSETVLDGWPIYVSTIIGNLPISDTVLTSGAGTWTITGLPQALYLVSEELGNAPTTGASSGYTNAAPAFAQNPPSEWTQTYPDANSSGANIDGVPTIPAGVLLGQGPYSWEVNLTNSVTAGLIDFGNHIPAPVCAVYPADTTICDESQVTLTAQRIAQGTPPYSYLWSGPNNFSAVTQSIVVPASAAGTYTVVLTDANGLSSAGCTGTVHVFPIPDFEIAGDSIVCALTSAHSYSVLFDPNSPVPIDSIVSWQWGISGNGTITSGTTDDSVTVSSTGPGSFTLALTVVDVYGCSETVTRTITVQANPVCSITPVGDVCPGSTGNIFSGPVGAYSYAWGISGNGSIIGSLNTPTVSVNAGVALGSFTLTLTITETSFPFCTSTCSLLVEVRDITPPVISCAADTTIECPVLAALPFTTPTATDNCDPNPGVVISKTVVTPGQCPNEFSVTRTWVATDLYGNKDSCSQTVHVIDTTAPVVTPASDLIVECDGAGNLAQLTSWLQNHGGASATDACGSVSWTDNFTALSDLCGATGSATVTFYATDACGNVDSTTATFTIVDTTPPAITLAAQDTTVECDGAGNTAALDSWLANHGGAIADDVCSDFDWTHNYSPNRFVPTCGGSGYVDVTFYATDECSNVDSTTARFTIEDTTPPDITVAAQDTTVECDGAGNTAALNSWLANHGGAVADDVCSDFDWTHNYSPNRFVPTCGGAGYVDVTFYATDDCNNVDSTSARFTIEDTTPPDITVAAQDTTAECDGAGNTTDLNNWLANHGGAVADDVCSDFDWTHNYNPNRFVPTCGGSGYVDVTFYATDDCNNVDSTTARFTIEDTTPPDITLAAQDTTVECDGAGNLAGLNSWLANHGGAVADDVCSDFDWTHNYNPNRFVPGCGGSGYVDVTFYATDDCNNVDSTTARFTIADTTPPDITLAAQDTTVECDGAGNTTDLGNWLANHGGAVADDVCSDFDWTHNFTALSDGCGATGSATVTFYATDDCGNVDSTTATFTIMDTTPPSISAGVIDTCFTNQADAEAAAIAATTSSDVCGGVTLTASTIGDCDAIITVRSTDACGNADSVSYNTTIDGTPPVFTYVPADTSIECTETPVFGTPTATDNCITVDVVQVGQDVTAPGSCPQEYSVTRTWKAIDGCGNQSPNVSQTIFVVDDTPPLITAAPDDTVACGQPVVFTDPTYSDNCDPNPSLIVVRDTVYYTSGIFTHIKSWQAKDTCDNISDTVSQTILEMCNQFETLTQGFYGNSGGSFCGTGQGTTVLIDSLLAASGDTIIVGVDGSGSLTIITGDANCVIQYLPGSGTPTALAHDFRFNQNNCNIIPNNMPLNNQGRFSNILLSQTITLALNLRLDTLLTTSFYLPDPSTPWMRTEGADYVNGICGDGDDQPDSTFMNFYFPPSVLSALGSNGTNKTAVDLLAMANQALAGTTFAGVSLAEIVEALDAINKGFDEARFFSGYYVTPPPKAASAEILPSGFELHQNYPNPFNPVTTITYTLPERSTVYLAVYNSLGEEVAVLVNGEMPSGTHGVTWDSGTADGNIATGVFTYRINAKGEDGTVFHDQRKMMLVK
jgi:hypothetical protein